MPPLAGGGYTAEISPRGAALRRLRHGERDLVTTWPEEGPVPYYAGTILAPWPNRVAGGRYTFGGEEHRLDLSEPERGNALHGLVATADWRVAEWLAAEDDHAFVRLTHTVGHAPGYPFTLELEVVHRLDAHGLTTTLTAVNTGDRPAPYGCAPHPWLLGGDVLQVPAERVLLTDEALLPRSLEDVAATPYDFRKARASGGIDVDHAFTGLTAGEVVAGGARITWDPAVLPWVQVCTGEQLGYRGIAVEPMTCPPGAFNSGDDLVVLDPGDRHEASWTISAA
ncbi:aldose 1-epimerase family protein [Nonomuraea sp. NBC_01738]|uniref:aldose 1-epimerase family protein n=1 Tax=Nonomuraea sp. NBC_01738 TaxID=2976003 RepID=UPI002E156998|nr:aldose 1-epimerase family protein [Nonomuraea sp. NBC_01738]